MSYSTTVSTSVVLIPTANSNPPYLVYLNNVSTAGRIVTVRDNDGFASATNQIVITPANGAFFQDGTTSITINQPYGFVTFTTALDGGYGVLNTFGFPTGSSAAFVSNITSSNINTSSLTTTTLTGTTANFTTMNINTISTGNIVIQSFTPSSIVTNTISTGTIQGGTLQFQTITGASIQTSNLQIPSLSTATGQFGIVTTLSTIVSTLAFTGDVTVHGAGTRTMVGTTRLIGTRGVAIGSNAGAGNDSVAIGISANASGTATSAVHIGIGAGFVAPATQTTAVGAFAGNQNQQTGAVGIGYGAGQVSQQAYGTAIGYGAAVISQQAFGISLGVQAGYNTQGERSIAIGPFAGQSLQGSRSIAIGDYSGYSSQGVSSIAIGNSAGNSSQGANSIAIGSFAGQTNQSTNTIILNASNAALNSDRSNAFYVAPIRDDQTGVGTRVAVYYNTTTKEMTTGPATGTNLIVSTVTTSTIQANSMTLTGSLLASTILANTLFTSTITNRALISTASVVADSIQTTTFSTGTISIGVGNIESVNTNSLSTNSLSVGSLNVTTLSTGSILLGSASIGSIATNTLSTGTITAQTGSISTFTAGSIVANTETVGILNTNTISTTTVTINGQTTIVNRQPLSIFVASGKDNTTDLKYSFNGLNFSNALTNGNFTGDGKGVAWNGRIFVAVGEDSTATATIRTSSNGTDWTNVASGGFSTGGYGIAWNGQMWVATGEHSTSPGHIQYSFNGSNWFSANTTTFTTRANRVAWGNGRWIVTGTDAGGAANSILTSIDGSNWSFATNTTGATANFPAYNGQVWLMGATGVGSNAILYSSNGINWSRVNSTLFTTACYGLAWNGRQWVAVGQGGMTIQTSQNGMVWEPAQTNMFTLLDGAGSNVIWNGSFWLACGFDNANSSNRIKLSVDGLNWTNSSGDTTFDTAVNSLAFSSQVNPDLATQQLNFYSQNIPNVLQSTNQILALQSTLVLNNTLFVNNPANCVGVNASVPQVPLHVVGGWNGQASQIMLQTLGSTLNTSMYISTNVGQAILGVVGPSNGFMTNTVPGDTILTTARTSNRLVLGNDASIGLFISSGTVVIPGTLAIGSAISTASVSTGSASFSNITVASSTIVSTLFFTGDVSIQASRDEIRIGSSAGISGQASGAIAIGTAAGQTTQGSLAVGIGQYAGAFSQGGSAVAIGYGPGFSGQGTNSVGIGTFAGYQNQGAYAIAIGTSGGRQTQGTNSVAIGYVAGYQTQGTNAIAIGPQAGSNTQGASAIAIGVNAGSNAQGANSIAIGAAAGQTSQHANTIVLNASGSALNSATTNATYVAPIRDDQGITGERTMVYYNQTTKEITTGPTTNLVLSSLIVTGAVAFPSVSTNVLSTTTVNAATVNVTTMNATTMNAMTISTTSIQASNVSTIQFMTSNIGVGIANPSTLVHIQGGAVVAGGSTQFMITGTGATPNTAMTIRNVSGQVFFGVAGTSGQYMTGTLAGDTFLRTDETPTTKKLLVGNGNGTPGITLSNNFVGIANTSPQYELDIVGSSRVTAQQYIGFSNSNTGTLRFLAAGGTNYIQAGSNNTTGSGNTLVFGTINNTTQTMVINTSTQQVGIGTTSPQYALDVNGPTRLNNAVIGSNSLYGAQYATFSFSTFVNSSNYALMQDNNGRTIINSAGRSTISFRSGNTELMTVNGANSNVGIGTTSPSERLAVNGAVYIYSTNTTTICKFSPGADASVAEQTTGNGITYTTYGWKTGSTKDNLEMYVYGTGNDGIVWGVSTNKLVSFASNVNIGSPYTYSQTNTLNVNGSINTTGGLFVSSFGTNNVFMNILGGGTTNGFIFGQYAAESATCIAQNFYYNNITATSTIANSGRGTAMITVGGLNGIGIHTNTTNKEPTERMRINQSGNVGIGTTSPVTPLHVVGFNSGFSDTLCIQGSATGNSNTAITFSNSATAVWGQIALAAGAGSYNMVALAGDMVFRSFDTTRKIILTTGSSGSVTGLVLSNNTVGIGKVPAYQLELSQNSAAKPTSSAWTTTSDERAKKNIVLADPYICYSTLQGIPLKYFEWNIYDPETQSTIGSDDKHSLGFIAQDVEKVFPNAVTTIERYGYSNFRSLDVDQLFKMHYGATQHLMKTVEQQSTLIQSLTTQVAELQASMSTVFGRLGV